MRPCLRLRISDLRLYTTRMAELPDKVNVVTPEKPTLGPNEEELETSSKLAFQVVTTKNHKSPFILKPKIEGQKDRAKTPLPLMPDLEKSTVAQAGSKHER